MKYIKALRMRLSLSESGLANKAGVSRLTVRQIESPEGNPTVRTLTDVFESLNRELVLLAVPKNSPGRSESSTVAVSLKVLQDGFESWPLHFMELVDDFRRDLDMRLLILSPVSQLDPKLKALLASITVALSEETGFASPSWARKSHFLPEPWFISGVESLKAMAILESPMAFRRNNIFVHDNFLKRA